MTTEIRFFALRSNKERVLDRGQNGFAVVSHIQRTGCQPEKNYFTHAARGLLNRGGKKRKKSGSAPSPPPALLVRRK